MIASRSRLFAIAATAVVTVIALSAPRLADRWEASAEPVSTVAKTDRRYAPRCTTDAVGAMIRIAEAGHAS